MDSETSFELLVDEFADVLVEVSVCWIVDESCIGFFVVVLENETEGFELDEIISDDMGI